MKQNNRCEYLRDFVFTRYLGPWTNEGSKRVI